MREQEETLRLESDTIEKLNKAFDAYEHIRFLASEFISKNSIALYQQGRIDHLKANFLRDWQIHQIQATLDGRGIRCDGWMWNGHDEESFSIVLTWEELDMFPVLPS